MRKSAPLRVCGFGLAVLAGAVGGCAPSPRAPDPQADVTLEVPKLSGDAAALPLDEGGVRFGREPARVGQRVRVRVQAESRWNDPQQGLETTVYDSDYTVFVLEVLGPAPSRVRVVFTSNVNLEMDRPTPTAIHGKSYLVSVGTPAVVDASTGLVPSAEEIARVTDVLPDLGSRAQIDQVLPDGAMQVGEHRDEIAAAITRILHPRHWGHERGSAVLLRADAANATFEVTLEATSSASSMRMLLRGRAHVRLADARLEGFELRGKFVRANGEEGDLTVTRTVVDL